MSVGFPILKITKKTGSFLWKRDEESTVRTFSKKYPFEFSEEMKVFLYTASDGFKQILLSNKMEPDDFRPIVVLDIRVGYIGKERKRKYLITSKSELPKERIEHSKYLGSQKRFGDLIESALAIYWEKNGSTKDSSDLLRLVLELWGFFDVEIEKFEERKVQLAVLGDGSSVQKKKENIVVGLTQVYGEIKYMTELSEEELSHREKRNESFHLSIKKGEIPSLKGKEEKKLEKIEKKKKNSKLFCFLEKIDLSSYYEEMKNDNMKYEELFFFLEKPDALEDYIPKKFQQIKLLKALRDERMKMEGERKDPISGEYDWNGKSIQIKEKFAYFEDRQYKFEKLTNNVYNINIDGEVHVFIWDDEDEMLRVVRAEGKYEFIKRVSEIEDVFGDNDPISGEYDWNGRSLDIKAKHVFLETERFDFEKVASTVYTVETVKDKKFVFHWDKQDKVLGVVEVGGEGFFEKIEKKVFIKIID